MANKRLATAALRALTARGFETKDGMCWRWARQSIMAAYGLPNPPSYHRGSAKEAGLAMLKAGLAFRTGQDEIEEGDILFKTNGEHGHVGIVVMWNGALAVAENSSYHWKRHRGDARGVRTLREFGPFDLVGRLSEESAEEKPSQSKPKPALAPQPEEEALLIWNDNPFPVLFDEDGRPYPQLAALCEQMGHDIIKTTDQRDLPLPRFYVNTAPKKEQRG